MYIPKMRQSKGEEEPRHESMGGVGLAEIENVKWDEGDEAWKRRRGEVFIVAWRGGQGDGHMKFFTKKNMDVDRLGR